jgi:hypothetical protein
MEAEYQGIPISIDPTSPHAGIFSQLFGRLKRIPVMHATPHQVVILDTAETKTVYECNLSRLTPGEFIWPVSYYVERPNVIPDNIRLMFKQQGLLIAVDDVTVEGVNNG